MKRTLLYTQIKPSDFDGLKDCCSPFTKDIFGASQEHIAAFDQAGHACLAGLGFLNQIYRRDSNHPYKIVLLQGEVIQDRPEESAIRTARTIHQASAPKNLYFSDDVFEFIQSNDITFEKRADTWVKDLGKNLPVKMLTRYENVELVIEPTDLFDFSHVDSYSSLDQVNPSGEPVVVDPFESSDTTLELVSKPGVHTESGKIAPVISQPISKPVPAFTSLKQQTSISKSPISKPVPRAPETVAPPASQLKSLVIIGVSLLLFTAGSFYLAKKPSAKKNVYTFSQKADTTSPSAMSAGVSTSQATTAAPTSAISDAFLNIHSTPSGAEVWIEGKKISKKTPVDKLKVEAEESITIDVEKKGYGKVTKKVELDSQEVLTVVFQLPVPKK